MMTLQLFWRRCWPLLWSWSLCTMVGFQFFLWLTVSFKLMQNLVYMAWSLLPVICMEKASLLSLVSLIPTTNLKPLLDTLVLPIMVELSTKDLSQAGAHWFAQKFSVLHLDLPKKNLKAASHCFPMNDAMLNLTNYSITTQSLFWILILMSCIPTLTNVLYTKAVFKDEWRGGYWKSVSTFQGMCVWEKSFSAQTRLLSRVRF